MPVPEEVNPSWAEDIDDEEGLPASVEELRDGQKIVTEYSRNEKGQKVKIVRTFKIEKKHVPKSIAVRKSLPKFGQSKGDKRGPNPATTIVAEEVFMQFITNKEEADKADDPLDKLKAAPLKGIVKCRYCKEDHWTTQCPYKDTLGPLQDKQAEEKKPQAASSAKESSGTDYVPPAKREGGAARKGETMSSGRRDNDNPNTLKVTSLTENATDGDVQELFGKFGDIARIFLVKDKITGRSRGLAFVTYKRREDAERALRTLNGFGYDHLILQVEWSLPKET